MNERPFTSDPVHGLRARRSRQRRIGLLLLAGALTAVFAFGRGDTARAQTLPGATPFSGTLSINGVFVANIRGFRFGGAAPGTSGATFRDVVVTRDVDRASGGLLRAMAQRQVVTVTVSVTPSSGSSITYTLTSARISGVSQSTASVLVEDISFTAAHVSIDGTALF